MEISTLTVKLIILLVPGALGTMIYKKLVIQHKTFSDFMFVIVSIMFGMFSYLLLQIILGVAVFIHNLICQNNISYYAIDTFANLSNGNIIPYSEVLLGSVASIILGFFVAKIDHNKNINKIAKYFKVSNKYGDENLYSFFLNSPDINWVYVRDLDNSLTYMGNVEQFAETLDYKELVLGDVTVYSYPDSEEMYSLEKIYLTFPKDKLKIEQAKILNDGKE